MSNFPLPWTGVYAALLSLMQIVLAVRVIRQRFRSQTDIHDPPTAETARVIGAHTNFTEYVPIALILLALAELMPRGPFLVHLMGGSLLLARLAHAYSMYTNYLPARAAGVLGTFCVIATGALIQLLRPWLGG